MSGNTFYLTLPSNDGSLKYFPDNKNNSWKNRLDKRIDLEGEWEVGLSSISLPHDSKVSSYLKGLKDDDVLLTTGRIKVATGDIQHKVTYNAKHLWQLLPEFGQISRRASALQISSTRQISLGKRFRIIPIGFESRNRTGDSKMATTILS